MKILYTAPDMAHIYKYHVGLIDQLKQNGHEIVLATGGKPQSSQNEELSTFVFIEGLSSHKKSNGAKELSNLIASIRPDMVIACSQPACNFTRWAIRLSGFRPERCICIDFGFNFDNETNGLVRFIRMHKARFFKKYTDLLVVSNAEDLRIAQRHNLAKDFMLTPALGIDLSGIEKSDASIKMAARARIGAKEDSFVLVMAGNFDANHRQKKIIENMLYLPRKIELFLIGEGKNLAKCKKRIFELGLEDSIHTPGFVSDKYDYLLAADATLSAIRYEGFPSFLVEGQALSIPCIVSAVKGNIDVVINGYNGLTYELGDSDSFIQAMRLMMYEEDFRAQLAQNSKRDIDKYERKKVVDLLVNYIEMAEERSK